MTFCHGAATATPATASITASRTATTPTTYPKLSSLLPPAATLCPDRSAVNNTGVLHSRGERLGGCESWRSSTSATRVRASSPRRSARPAATLDEWTLAERPQPPGDPLGYDAVLVLGGAMNVDEGERHGWIAEEEALLRELLAREVPLLGLCLGGQLLAAAAGAEPRRASRPEIGWHRVEVTPEGEDDPLLGPLAPSFEAFQWHSYEFPLPARRRPPRPQRGLPPGRPPRRARLGPPVPPRGQPRRRPALGRGLPQRPRRGPDRHRPGGARPGDRGEDRRLQRARPRALRRWLAVSSGRIVSRRGQATKEEPERQEKPSGGSWGSSSSLPSWWQLG